MDLAQFTPATWIGASLALVLALGIIFVGVSYLVAPTSTGRGFGFTSAITPEVTPWQHIKGPRDIVSGLVVIAMLVFFGPAAAAVILLVEALTPIGDALMIVRNHGRLAVAVGVHASTAAVMIVAAVLLFL
ncbi:hypothetical protein ASE14_11365 [Agromyces sp. Root81]|uniref:DUF4267 domain-containing protein n=1 Tax=Agromyces sp. Root81 TaxID=1736601 RepID=UPI000702063C|nr:DUF4267 domain-containing protein [Agromyces sp. Root81]KRC61459.1 hypothetical protein ASE14_11365 [Agromyces sp. Root81]